MSEETTVKRKIKVYRAINKFDDETKEYKPFDQDIGSINENESVTLCGSYKFKIMESAEHE